MFKFSLQGPDAGQSLVQLTSELFDSMLNSSRGTLKFETIALYRYVVVSVIKNNV